MFFFLQGNSVVQTKIKNHSATPRRKKTPTKPQSPFARQAPTEKLNTFQQKHVTWPEDWLPWEPFKRREDNYHPDKEASIESIMFMEIQLHKGFPKRLFLSQRRQSSTLASVQQIVLFSAKAMNRIETQTTKETSLSKICQSCWSQRDQ